MYPQRMLGKIRKLEEVWEKQERFFPSLFLRRECCFPKKFEYYRYISAERLARYLDRLDEYIDVLKEMGNQVDRALEWITSTSEEEYESFLSSFGWVLAASGYRLECWQDIVSLESNYDKIMTMGDGTDLSDRVEILDEFHDMIYSQLHYLNETIDVIKYVTSLEPKPVPFFTMRRYEEDEVVVCVCNQDGMEEGTLKPYALKVKYAFSMRGEQCIDTRPLSESELAALPVDLPTKDYASWMKNMRSNRVIPLAVYGFYTEHLDILAEHWRVLSESGLLTPVIYEALSAYFNV